MLVDLASVVPDGIVAFFVSYLYMDTIVSKWNDMGILQVSGASTGACGTRGALAAWRHACWACCACYA